MDGRKSSKKNCVSYIGLVGVFECVIWKIKIILA